MQSPPTLALTVDPSPSHTTTTRTLFCGEVAGGNQPAHTMVELAGLRGTLFSRPCHGARGGDVHYLSVCGAGLLSRVCVADVAGHGEVVAKVGSMMHAELRRSVDTIDERRVFQRMDQTLGTFGTRAMTTAALITYYAPSRRLTFSYAGHPPGWLWHRRESRWQRLEPETTGVGDPYQGLPLGTGLASSYSRRKTTVEIGDRLVLVTDGVLEAPAACGDGVFGIEGLEAVLEKARDRSCEEIAATLIAAVRAYAGDDGFEHDDITAFVGEFVPGPRGPAIWHVLKSRLRTRPTALEA